jgi:hypothetical protein
MIRSKFSFPESDKGSSLQGIPCTDSGMAWKNVSEVQGNGKDGDGLISSKKRETEGSAARGAVNEFTISRN